MSSLFNFCWTFSALYRRWVDCIDHAQDISWYNLNLWNLFWYIICFPGCVREVNYWIEYFQGTLMPVNLLFYSAWKNALRFLWKLTVVLCRGGKYSEEDAKAVLVQILSVVAFCHLQGVVHRDLKPEVIF